MSHLDFRTPVIRAVQAVQLVEKARHRIPRELQGQSFFGAYDIWRYEGIADNKLCERCLNFFLRGPKGSPYYLGNELRVNFPDLEIETVNLIMPNVHPNCRCKLHRIIASHEYLYVLEHYA